MKDSLNNFSLTIRSKFGTANSLLKLYIRVKSVHLLLT